MYIIGMTIQRIVIVPVLDTWLVRLSGFIILYCTFNFCFVFLIIFDKPCVRESAHDRVNRKIEYKKMFNIFENSEAKYIYQTMHVCTALIRLDDYGDVWMCRFPGRIESDGPRARQEVRICISVFSLIR